MIILKGTKINGQGKLNDDSKKMFNAFIAKLQEGDEFHLIPKRPGKKRSLKQNAYYWGVIVNIIAEFMGEDENGAHEALRYRFLKVRNDRGEVYKIKSTTELSTAQAEDYYAKIRQTFSIEFGVQIPEPNETEFDYT